MTTKLEERYNGYAEALEDIMAAAMEDLQFSDMDRLRALVNFLRADRLDFEDVGIEELSLDDILPAEEGEQMEELYGKKPK